MEFGIGMDFHGQDVNRAAEKAVQDAVSKSCLCGLEEVLGIKDLNREVYVEITIAVTKPEEIDADRIKQCIPIGKKNLKAVYGGLKVPGLYIPEFGDKDNSIEAALACIEVSVK
ncbi:Lin0512 family protein [Tissierella sp. P1]|uniref:Lin0512 family protein n=1 Tax=Tissierella sp. P1 TaxID=1280483 RepID=UPI0021016197|nr:Lin0512 family protein [Tissierella sp. P1]